MKNASNLFIVACLIFLCHSCSEDAIETIMQQDSIVTLTQVDPKNKENNPNGNRSASELIISYKNDISLVRRRKLRAKYQVMNYKRCSCSNERIEKWEFNEDTDVEERMDDIAQETDVEGVDFQFNFTSKSQITDLPSGDNNNRLFGDWLVGPYRKGVNIGVMDTGINLDIMRVRAPFLYRSKSDILCKENGYKEISGWDFVNNDNSPYDELGHGTIVTDRIIENLEKTKVNFSILPVKVFNHQGKGNTFDILCGYLYLVNKGDIHIINMSFGWYGNTSRLLEKYMDQNRHILHVTSAGNKNDNNDSSPHFPSSMPFNHVLSIGSYTINDTLFNGVSKSDFSNYGTTSVDYLAEGDDIYFIDRYHNMHPIAGTSYAAPLVTAKLALYRAQGYTMIPDLLTLLHTNATLVGKANFEVKYKNKIIGPY